MAIPENGAHYSPRDPWIQHAWIGDYMWRRFGDPILADLYFPRESRVARVFDELMVRMGVTIR